METEVSPSDIQLYFEKIARGLYFHHIGRVLDGEVRSFLDFAWHPNPPNRDLIIRAIPYESRMAIGASQNPEVFQYKYYADERLFYIIMVFYQGPLVVSEAVRHGEAP